MTTVPEGKTLRLMVDNAGMRLLFMPPLMRYVKTLDAYGFEFTNQYEFARRECSGGLELRTIADSLIHDLGLYRHDTNPESTIEEYWIDED